MRRMNRPFSTLRLSKDAGWQAIVKIILGRKALEAMKTNIGNVVRLGEIGFRVVGVYETSVAYEGSAGVMSLRDAQDWPASRAR